MRLAGWLMLGIVGCGGGSGDFGAAPPMGCTPGEQHECSCPGGAKSVQVCEDDGAKYGACECGSADAAVEATVADGACGAVVCGVVPNGESQCVDGHCHVTMCLNGMKDCDRVVENGCECLGDCLGTACVTK